MVGMVWTPSILQDVIRQEVDARLAYRRNMIEAKRLGKSRMARLVPTETGVVVVDVETSDDPR